MTDPMPDLGDVLRWGKPAIPDEAVDAFIRDQATRHGYSGGPDCPYTAMWTEPGHFEQIRAGLAAAWPYLIAGVPPYSPPPRLCCGAIVGHRRDCPALDGADRYSADLDTTKGGDDA